MVVASECTSKSRSWDDDQNHRTVEEQRQGLRQGDIGFDELVKLIDSANLHGKKCNILIFANDQKQSDKSPDFSLSLAEDTKEPNRDN